MIKRRGGMSQTRRLAAILAPMSQDLCVPPHQLHCEYHGGLPKLVAYLLGGPCASRSGVGF